MKGTCGKALWQGDTYCDDDNNNAGCDWDGGDCCSPDHNYDYCSACECLVSERPKSTRNLHRSRPAVSHAWRAHFVLLQQLL